MWCLGYWNWVTGGPGKNLELGARKALPCYKQRSKVHSGGSLKERNAERNTDTGGSAHEILGRKKNFYRGGGRWSKEREDTHTHTGEREMTETTEKRQRQRGQPLWGKGWTIGKGSWGRDRRHWRLRAIRMQIHLRVQTENDTEVIPCSKITAGSDRKHGNHDLRGRAYISTWQQNIASSSSTWFWRYRYEKFKDAGLLEVCAKVQDGGWG